MLLGRGNQHLLSRLKEWRMMTLSKKICGQSFSAASWVSPRAARWGPLSASSSAICMTAAPISAAQIPGPASPISPGISTAPAAGGIHRRRHRAGRENGQGRWPRHACRNRCVQARFPGDPAQEDSRRQGFQPARAQRRRVSSPMPCSLRMCSAIIRPCWRKFSAAFSLSRRPTAAGLSPGRDSFS